MFYRRNCIRLTMWIRTVHPSKFIEMNDLLFMCYAIISTENKNDIVLPTFCEIAPFEFAFWPNRYAEY